MVDSVSLPNSDSKVKKHCCACVPVSQHALAAKVEVYEGAESVLLPCRVGFLLEDTTVTWTRPDLDPSAIHRRHEDRDEPDGQNMRYRGRTAMRANEADPKDLSLTLSKPELSDTGSYDCIISKQKDVLKLTDVELQVKGQHRTLLSLKSKQLRHVRFNSLDHSALPHSVQQVNRTN